MTSNFIRNRILDAFQLVFVSHALYLDTVTNFANPTTISVLQWSLCVSSAPGIGLCRL